MRNALFLTSLLLLQFVVPGHAQEVSHVQSTSKLVMSVRGRDCHHGLQHQPNGPFAVITFCEDAMGTYIAVVCYDADGCEKSDFPDGSTRFAGWDNTRRVWQ